MLDFLRWGSFNGCYVWNSLPHTLVNNNELCCFWLIYRTLLFCIFIIYTGEDVVLVVVGRLKRIYFLILVCFVYTNVLLMLQRYFTILPSKYGIISDATWNSAVNTEHIQVFVVLFFWHDFELKSTAKLLITQIR